LQCEAVSDEKADGMCADALVSGEGVPSRAGKCAESVLRAMKVLQVSLYFETTLSITKAIESLHANTRSTGTNKETKDGKERHCLL